MSFALKRGFGFRLRNAIVLVAPEQVKVVAKLQPVVNLLYITVCPPDGTVTARRFPEFVSQAIDNLSRMYDECPAAVSSVNDPNAVPPQIQAFTTLFVVPAMSPIWSVPFFGAR